MATKKQLMNDKLRKIFVATTGSTADRDTKINDLQYNLYAWRISDGIMAARFRKMRTDIIL